jgi:hypothetical protein
VADPPVMEQGFKKKQFVIPLKASLSTFCPRASKFYNQKGFIIKKISCWQPLIKARQWKIAPISLKSHGVFLFSITRNLKSLIPKGGILKTASFRHPHNPIKKEVTI